MTTVKELAKMIANEFNNDVEEGGFENFKEMKRTYDWDAQQIKDEIYYMITRKYEDLTGITMMDDYSIYNAKNWDDEDVECSYRKFKKMVFAEVK